jgi:hypothetical protein
MSETPAPTAPGTDALIALAKEISAGSTFSCVNSIPLSRAKTVESSSNGRLGTIQDHLMTTTNALTGTILLPVQATLLDLLQPYVGPRKVLP